MSMVRFASICDACGRRSPEYIHHPTCSECLADLCPACMPEFDPESNRGVCAPCKADMAMGGVQ